MKKLQINKLSDVRFVKNSITYNSFCNPFFFHISRQQEAEASAGGGVTSAPLVSELRLLRQRKDELEGHLSSLQESRKHLMHQLEGLMRMLKVTLQKYLSVFLFYTVTSYSTAQMA